MLSQEALQKKVDDWQKQMVELQQIFVEYNKELEKKQKELTDPIFERVLGAHQAHRRHATATTSSSTARPSPSSRERPRSDRPSASRSTTAAARPGAPAPGGARRSSDAPPAPAEAVTWDGVVRLRSAHARARSRARHGGRSCGHDAARRRAHRPGRRGGGGRPRAAPLASRSCARRAGGARARRGAPRRRVARGARARRRRRPRVWVHDHATWAMAERARRARVVADAPAVVGRRVRPSAPSAVLGPRVVLGARVTHRRGRGHRASRASAGPSGAEGAGAARSRSSAGVVIEDDVVDRPALHVDAGHARRRRASAAARSSTRTSTSATTCDIGEGTIVAAQCGFAGSVTDRRAGCSSAGRSGIADHVSSATARASPPRAASSAMYPPGRSWQDTRRCRACAGCARSRSSTAAADETLRKRRVKHPRPSTSTASSQILPHRWPFVLVDRVTDVVPGERIVGHKCVTMGEPWFQGHFPARPIMPGVLILEALAQIGGILAYASEPFDASSSLMYFLGHRQGEVPPPGHPGRPARSRGDDRAPPHERVEVPRRGVGRRHALRERELLASVVDRARLMAMPRATSTRRARRRPARRARGATSSSGRTAIVEAGRHARRAAACSHAHAVVRGPDRRSGRGNVGASRSRSSAGEPQAKRHAGGPARLVIGDGNVFREHVTVHGGTDGRRDAHRLAATSSWSAAHVAHDVVVGSHVRLRERRAARRPRGRRGLGRRSAASAASRSSCASARAPSSRRRPRASATCRRSSIVQGDRARVRGAQRGRPSRRRGRAASESIARARARAFRATLRCSRVAAAPEARAAVTSRASRVRSQDWLATLGRSRALASGAARPSRLGSFPPPRMSSKARSNSSSAPTAAARTAPASARPSEARGCAPARRGTSGSRRAARWK